MNKIESLKTLLETVEEKGKLASSVYCRGENNCVIGHLLKIGGVSQEQLIKIDKGAYGNNNYAIGSILRNAQIDFVNEALESLGFNIELDEKILTDLQLVNDYEGMEAAIKQLKQTIKTLEEK